MTDDDIERTVLRRGFRLIKATKKDDRLLVSVQKRKHRFGSGYEPVGSPRVIYEGTLGEASLLGEALTEVFHSEGNEQQN